MARFVTLVGIKHETEQSISSSTTALYFIATKIAPRLEREKQIRKKENIFTKEKQSLSTKLVRRLRHKK